VQLPYASRLVRRTSTARHQHPDYCCQGFGLLQEPAQHKTAQANSQEMLDRLTNFKKALNAYKKDPSKFIKRPKPPYYKDKLAQSFSTTETIKEDRTRRRRSPTPLRRPMTASASTAPEDYKQVILTPKRFGFVVDVQYEQPAEPKSKAKGNCVRDIGLNNLNVR